MREATSIMHVGQRPGFWLSTAQVSKVLLSEVLGGQLVHILALPPLAFVRDSPAMHVLEISGNWKRAA